MVVLYNIIVLSAAAWYLLLLFSDQTKGTSAKLYVVFFSIVMIFLSACRFQGKGSDYYNYRVMFIQDAGMSWQEIFSQKREIGFAVLLKLCSYITMDPQIMFFPCALLTIVPFACFFCRYSEDAPLSLFIFFAFGYFFTSNNITRQYVAVGLTVIACHYAIKRKLFLFILFIFIASLIHTSALFLLIIYPLCSVRFTKTVAAGYIIIVPIILLLFPLILSYVQKYFYGDYDSGYGTTGSNILGIVVPIFLFFIAIVEINVKNKIKKEYMQSGFKNRYLYNLTFNMIGVFFVLSFCQVFKMLIIGRLLAYCNVGVCLFVPLIGNLFVRKEQKSVKVLLICFASLYFFVLNFLGKLTPTPYIFFFSV